MKNCNFYLDRNGPLSILTTDVIAIIQKNKYINIIMVINIVFLLYIFINEIDSIIFLFSISWRVGSIINCSIGKITNINSIKILILGENFSFDAILLIYINKISSPPTSIRNIIIGIHEDFIIFVKKIVEIKVCNNSKVPIIRGVLIVVIIVAIYIIILIVIVLITTSILIKILVLGINDVVCYLVEVLKVSLNLVYKTNIFIKLLKLIFYLFFYIYFFSLVSFFFIRKHIFLCLLRLEFIIISLLLIYIYYSILFGSGLYLIIIIIVLFVCEGVLGLRVLVRIIRCYRNDYLNSISLW